MNRQIIVVANSMKASEFEEIKGIIAGECDYPVFFIRKSRYVAEMLFIPESIEVKYRRGGLTAYALKDIREQFRKLFDHL